MLDVDGIVWRTPTTAKHRAERVPLNNRGGSAFRTPGCALTVRLLSKQSLYRLCLGDFGGISGLSAERFGNLGKYLAELQVSAPHCVLPYRREEYAYTLAIGFKLAKKPITNKNASQRD
ncbi:hypothetical protein [Pseudomonas sp.]|uniref:hypothetical protein n=1 Tax=Pseudomonas sp. TaxID=306 RepID=UPI003BB5BA57